MSNTFKIGQVELSYCRATNNRAWENERAVEVSLGEWFLHKFGLRSVEVGSVMMNYGWDMHIMLDLSDDHPKVLKYNALDCDYHGCNVLSLSTVEHFMKREYNNGSDEDSITFVKKIMSESDNYLITFPCRYNEFLDEFIQNSDIPRVLLKRVSEDNKWIQDFDVKNMNYIFGHRDQRTPDGVFNNANAIVCVTNLPEILDRNP